MRDDELAVSLAAAAGGRLLEVRSSDLEGTALKAEGDRAAQEVLARLLAEHRPGDAVLSEEAADDPSRLGADRVWIIDPLDGTREFSERPREDWAVHVALWADGELVAGAVTQPAADVVHSTRDETDLVPPGDRLRLAVSRSRPPAFVQRLADALDAELVAMGSAGVKAMSVLRGETDAYVHAGGQYEWDSAAPVAVARAAGLHTSRVDGSPLRYNQPDPYLPDLVVCHPQVADRVLDAIRLQLDEVSTAP
ncbi:3'(2'),5'-bisphosphate nucleotidase CysQ [Aquipuribacter sp. SD81]|uniref:3'(2'),5'-bisphosphate nucleotidase CysQ n=1 Tax=Aquipuribacter sp. SD81 TaxID=3127703 RepID=UPI003015FC1F